MTTSARTATIEIDDHELEQLEVDLKEAPGRMQRDARKALKRGAEIVDKGMKRDARGHRYLPRLPRSVTHELIDMFTAEIGLSPIPGTQGRLAHIIAYGSVNNAPVYDYTAALRRSTPEILELFGAAAEDAALGSRDA
jgi:hypothetical protein